MGPRLWLAACGLSAAAASVSFGIYDVELSPGGGWEVMSAEDFNTHKSDFIKQYNTNKGVSLIKTF